MRHYIFVNGLRVYLDEKKTSEGEFRVHPESLSEQCDDCGEDIAQSGQAVTLNGKLVNVECFCGMKYTVKEV
jgi:hypothetical protein